MILVFSFISTSFNDLLLQKFNPILVSQRLEGIQVVLFHRYPVSQTFCSSLLFRIAGNHDCIITVGSWFIADIVHNLLHPILKYIKRLKRINLNSHIELSEISLLTKSLGLSA